MNNVAPNKEEETVKTDSKKKVKLPKSILIFAGIYLIFLIVIIYNMPYYQFFKPWHDKESYNQLLHNESFEKVEIDNNGKTLYGWLNINFSLRRSFKLIQRYI